MNIARLLTLVSGNKVSKHINGSVNSVLHFSGDNVLGSMCTLCRENFVGKTVLNLGVNAQFFSGSL